MDSKSSLKSMSSGVLGGRNKDLQQQLLASHSSPATPWIKTFLHGKHFCLDMEIKMSK